MGSRIPIKQAKAIGLAHQYDQVIILARRIGDDGLEWVTTWGKDRIHCAAAAKIGDALRDNVAPTLERQVAEIEDLKLQLAKATGK